MHNILLRGVGEGRGGSALPQLVVGVSALTRRTLSLAFTIIILWLTQFGGQSMVIICPSHFDAIPSLSLCTDTRTTAIILGPQLVLAPGLFNDRAAITPGATFRLSLPFRLPQCRISGCVTYLYPLHFVCSPNADAQTCTCAHLCRRRCWRHSNMNARTARTHLHFVAVCTSCACTSFLPVLFCAVLCCTCTHGLSYPPPPL